MKNDATLGAMRAYFKIKNYNKATEYANDVLTLKGLSEIIQVEAVFYRGIAQLNLKNTAAAILDLESVIKRINNEWAAESKYNLALIAYQKNELENAEKLCFEFISIYPSYPEWMVKSYILLSDVYVSKGEYFKAKVTLQSVVDSYEKKDDLYNQAIEKLNKVKDLESQGTNVNNRTGVSGFSEFEK